MRPSLKVYSRQVLIDLFSFKKTNRVWHLPFLAAICVGIPLFTSYYLGYLDYGLVASMAGLVILYIPFNSTRRSQQKKLLWCSFGFVISYAIGLVFSFNFLASCLAFGVFSAFVHWTCLKLKLKAPGNFFFIMLASLSSSLPFNPMLIPFKLSLIILGTLFATGLAFIYSLSISQKIIDSNANATMTIISKSKAQYFLESAILGFFMFLSLFVGHLLQLQNAYWIPISCLAVLQGVSLYHIWSRVIQRILGTFIGLALCWFILAWLKNPFSICMAIVILQLIVEFLIVRHYALAVVFITPMTLLLVEAANPIIQNPNHLLPIRITDIALGSFLGAIGGWFLHHEKIRHHSVQKIQKAKLLFRKI